MMTSLLGARTKHQANNIKFIILWIECKVQFLFLVIFILTQKEIKEQTEQTIYGKTVIDLQEMRPQIWLNGI